MRDQNPHVCRGCRMVDANIYARILSFLAHLRTYLLACLGPITYYHHVNVILRQAASSTKTAYKTHHPPGEQLSSSEGNFFIGDVAIVLLHMLPSLREINETFIWTVLLAFF